MWARENEFNHLFAEAARTYAPSVNGKFGVTEARFMALMKAHAGAESAFDPMAYNPEAQSPESGGSRGLMQMSLRTARSLGFSGDARGLFDPRANVMLAGLLIRDNLRTAISPDAAISAYNAGFSRERAGDGKRTTNSASAPFVNQEYVGRVQRYLQYFDRSNISNNPIPPSQVIARAGCLPVLILPLIVGVLYVV